MSAKQTMLQAPLQARHNACKRSYTQLQIDYENL